MHLRPPETTAEPDDPERIRDAVWNQFRLLFENHNQRLTLNGATRLDQKDLARLAGVSPTTFNTWWTTKTVPSDFLPLVNVAVRLGGDRDDWARRWQRARGAHERVLNRSHSPRRRGIPVATLPITPGGGDLDPRPEAGHHPSLPSMVQAGTNQARPTQPDNAAGHHDQTGNDRAQPTPVSPPPHPIESSGGGAPLRRIGQPWRWLWSCRRRRRVRYVIAAGVVAVFVAVGVSWYALGRSPGRQWYPIRSVDGVATVEIPTSSLTPRVATEAGAGGRTTITGYVFRNVADNLCLGAATGQPAAGRNGDQVQIGDCLAAEAAADQIWIPISWRITGGTLTLLANYGYQGMCLNADIPGGATNGRRVQLWDCYPTVNEDWGFNRWHDTVWRLHTPEQISLRGAGRYCLDANKRKLGDRDPVAIWDCYPATNQYWF